jgi:hypothetical protein
MNRDTKMLSEVLANQTQQYIDRTTYHEQVQFIAGMVKYGQVSQHDMPHQQNKV